MVWPTLHFPIFLADWDQGTIKFDVFCKSKKSIKFSLRLITFYYFKDLKNFNHGQYGLTHIVLSKKKKKNDQTVFELRCTSQTFYQKLYVLNHIVRASILYKFPRKAPFSIFIKSCIFFSIYTILNKLNQGQYGLTHTG